MIEGNPQKYPSFKHKFGSPESSLECPCLCGGCNVKGLVGNDYRVGGVSKRDLDYS